MPKKKPKEGTLTRRCDRLFSLYIRKRDGACQHCGSTEFLQCAHGFSRRYFSSRWAQWNAWALCRDCHVYFTHRPLEWEAWLQEKWGFDQYVLYRALALGKFMGDKSEMAKLIKERLDELEAA